MRLVHLLADGFLSDTLLVFPAIVLVGLLLAKKSFPQAGAGALSVLLGWLVMLAGLQLIAGSLVALDGLFGLLFERSIDAGRSATLEPVLKMKKAYLHAQAFAVLLAYLVNILWARFSPARFLFLNPIHTLLGTGLLTILFARVGASPYLAVPITGVLVGSAMAWLPYLATKPAALMNGDNRVVLGSFHTGLLWLTAWLAPKLGGADKRNAKEPKEIVDASNIRSPILFGGGLVALLALLLAINAGEEKTDAILKSVGVLSLLPSVGSSYWAVGALMIGFGFAAGLWVLLLGMPWVVRGVADAFDGFQRLLPGTRPGLDGLFIMSEMPRVAVIGFLLSFAGGTLGYYLFGWLGLKVAIPGMLVALSAGHLIGGGAAATIARRFGGQRAMWAFPAVHGLALALIAALAMTASSGLGKAKAGLALELSDLSVLSTLLGSVLQLFD